MYTYAVHVAVLVGTQKSSASELPPPYSPTNERGSYESLEGDRFELLLFLLNFHPCALLLLFLLLLLLLLSLSLLSLYTTKGRAGGVAGAPGLPRRPRRAERGLRDGAQGDRKEKKKRYRVCVCASGVL